MKNEFEQYYTPDEAVRSLTRHFHFNGNLFEPCVGSGQIIKNISGDWITADLMQSKDFSPNYVGFDASIEDNWKGLNIDYTITNPPFSKAPAILKNALKYSNRGVAFLVRLTFLEPCNNRVDIFKDNPPSKIIFLNRTKFKEENGKVGSDLCSHCWIIWDDTQVDEPLVWETNKEFNWRS